MAHVTRHLQALLPSSIAACVACGAWVIGFAVGPAWADTVAAGVEPQLTDSLYKAHHPRLLFKAEEIPALYAKVRDGGNDDLAYAFVRNAAQLVYPGMTMEELLDIDYALEPIPNLALASFLEATQDTAALSLGRDITLYIAVNYGINANEFDSALRLRSLALGYDMFFEDATESVRDYVRDEMVAYIDAMMSWGGYRVWPYRPYLGNKSVMIAASLGLAAIALDGETAPGRVTAALDVGDEIIDKWQRYQLDENGAYNEGVTYGSWSMRMLIYYFYARKRYDGHDYSNNSRIRDMETWFAYELLPEGSGRTNNLNDCGYEDYILSRHHTYFDWAQTAWGSNLSSWLWEYTAGDQGWDWEYSADKAATVVWNRSLSLAHPEDVLPQSCLWENRGLYYYRSGWEMGPSSSDVVFSFYSGVFQGAHAQEDQGQFTLYGYGTKFAIDHGPGSVAKQSEAHNLVLIDGDGQHNAGSSIGTDGYMPEYLLSDYADYVVSDLTSAYTTHSKWNNPDVPFSGTDWSWGYDGGNPVVYAFRTVVAVHDNVRPPYFIILDEIDKDGLTHQYEWRMHTHDINTVDTSTNPIKISNGASILDVHLIEPPFDSVQKLVTPFNDQNDEPNSLVLSIAATDTIADFAVLLIPSDNSVSTPSVSKDEYPWGYTVTLDWGGDIIDVFVRNKGGDPIALSIPTTAELESGGSSESDIATVAADLSLTTDATLAIVQIRRNRLRRYLLANTSELSFRGRQYVSVTNGRLSCGLSRDLIQIDRYDADFTFYAPFIDDVYYRGQKISVIYQLGYISRDWNTGVAGENSPDFFIRANAYPNPFNPSTTVTVELTKRAHVEANIYDARGQLVDRLWQGELPPGTSSLQWNGTNQTGVQVASGVYFLKIQARGIARTLKLIVIK